jgi:hypothetical protein
LTAARQSTLLAAPPILNAAERIQLSIRRIQLHHSRISMFAP